ncbi:hypothetical protein ACFQE1_04315 [Halobium palmae]|uniref:Uncharacterized protein n=1 Tax=Halobium palmae TaxID=1776492 RepID=A0ABD5RW68_9EURY
MGGNDHAVDNSGGGAPEQNTNAATHGAFSDWRKHDARLEGEAREYVDELYAETLAHARVTAPDLDPEKRQQLARESAVLCHLETLAMNDGVDRGIAFEKDVEYEDENGGAWSGTVPAVNPAMIQASAISSRQREIHHELGLFDFDAIKLHRSIRGPIEPADHDYDPEEHLEESSDA